MTKLVRPQKISDQVLAVLEERIATGIYEEGSKLPPERYACGRIRRIAAVGQGGVEYFNCQAGFGSAAGRWLLCFRQAAAGFFTKLAGFARQAYQLGNRRIRFQLSR